MAFVWNKTTPATGAQAMYELKGLLKLAGWSVLSSSDGTTYNAAGDQISNGGAGANGMANNSAWFRIRSPAGAGAVSFTFQRGTTNQAWRIKRSRTAGFTGGSPGATQTPSATDEGIMTGGGTDAAPTYVNLQTTDGTYRWNAGADNAAPYGWWAGSFLVGGGVPLTFLCHDPLTGTEATDADQAVFWMAISGQNPLQSASMVNESQAATTRAQWSTIISTSSNTYTGWPVAILYNNANTRVYVP